MCIYISKCYFNLPMCLSHQKCKRKVGYYWWLNGNHPQTDIDIHPTKQNIGFYEKKFSTWASKSCIPTANLVFALSFKLESICIYQRRRNCMVHDLDNSHKYFMYSKWFDRKPGPFKTVRNHSPTLLLFYDKRKIK